MSKSVYSGRYRRFLGMLVKARTDAGDYVFGQTMLMNVYRRSRH